ncbi:hypothetical protein F4859DRAFT_496857 [Xylaria cf. heliscus]|nr:hypothetical protein F4859DRAFT_496857 [Xylaria cf. heliscus]
MITRIRILSCFFLLMSFELVEPIVVTLAVRVSWSSIYLLSPSRIKLLCPHCHIYMGVATDSLRSLKPLGNPIGSS